MFSHLSDTKEMKKVVNKSNLSISKLSNPLLKVNNSISKSHHLLSKPSPPIYKFNNPISISCIIPAWNEAKNISKVLDVVKDFPDFMEVIIVDDGSTDNMVEVVQSYLKKYPHLKLFSHEKNKGKTAAVLTGIKETSGELIVLIDADLISLSHDNINQMIKPILSKESDMTILDRAGDRDAVWGWTNCARLFGGERAFWKNDFLEMDLPPKSRYLLEVIMNLHYIKNGKKVRNIYCPNLFTVHQYDKVGKLRGYYSYLKTSIKIVRKATIKDFLLQISSIEDDYGRVTSQEKQNPRLKPAGFHINYPKLNSLKLNSLKLNSLKLNYLKLNSLKFDPVKLKSFNLNYIQKGKNIYSQLKLKVIPNFESKYFDIKKITQKVGVNIGKYKSDLSKYKPDLNKYKENTSKQWKDSKIKPVKKYFQNNVKEKSQKVRDYVTKK